MNEFRDSPSVDPSPSDPLERLIDAFVGQSAPDGPDGATQRRMLAAMTALSIEPTPVAPGGTATIVALGARPKIRFGAAAHQLAAIAAAILVVAAAAALIQWQPVKPATPSGPTIEELMALPTLPAGAQPEARSLAADEFRDLTRDYLQDHDGRMPDEAAFLAMIRRVAKNHELAESKSWQFAQERITHALEQPRVIGMGVGLLGTLPWTTYGRF